ncbi:STAS domain-containing protein [Saccharopolyspora sp. 6T]|uniref:STAS domain-containing protein n=1 Tax=unclassified Saccharopolyspora TaxID=2646250 RepID=UPI001CD55B7D|nr:STAS domain-containing protein [Saccharopolyspora sp. 6T]MCA1278415.1 STAS domain-containing protein [Saccharopolyspora sp. 7B]
MTKETVVVGVPRSADAVGRFGGFSATTVVFRPDSDTAVVQVNGEIDLNCSGRLRELLENRIDSVVNRIVLDLGSVSFVDTAGVELIESCRGRAYVRGKSFEVIGPESGSVVRLMNFLKGFLPGSGKFGTQASGLCEGPGSPCG